jgi:hypothetical protein
VRRQRVTFGLVVFTDGALALTCSYPVILRLPEARLLFQSDGDYEWAGKTGLEARSKRD